MTTTISPKEERETNAFILHFAPLMRKLTDEDFYDFCQLNPDLRLECTAEGDLIIMPPTGAETGGRNFTLIVVFGNWVIVDGTGKGFDSSTIFKLPNGAHRSPDLAWVKLSRWQALTKKERRGFAPLCPDFVVELRSHTDSLSMLKEKMDEYIANGAQLGWLIDPIEKKVYVYRPGAQAECLDNPETLSGDPLLKGFTLALEPIW
ncbi:MAG TPA: Uma2 family endonuclease [Blastocatellia bacterium]|nr:Uma2 family endonuclease [Blastocatellia bacterium]